MSIKLLWENEAKTIIRMEVIGQWTWEEMYAASQEGYTMLESVDHVVDPIIDFRSSAAIPIYSITHARHMIGRRHPRTGLTVMVGTSALLHNLWDIFRKVYALFVREEEFTLVRTLEEAHAVLARVQANRSDAEVSTPPKAS
ncbi:MAG: hypothetical protein K8L97_05690 [Anaerolineae bacterium]|nr:hypothetical protein [Anaerolineae bacterium]